MRTGTEELGAAATGARSRPSREREVQPQGTEQFARAASGSSGRLSSVAWSADRLPEALRGPTSDLLIWRFQKLILRIIFKMQMRIYAEMCLLEYYLKKKMQSMRTPECPTVRERSKRLRSSCVIKN